MSNAVVMNVCRFNMVLVPIITLLLVVLHPTFAINSLLAEPSCVNDLKMRCANAGTAAVSELDILECIQLYEVKYH